MVLDEEGDFALEEEAYDDQIRVWLRNERALEVQKLAKNFSPFPYTDDYRCLSASSYGGFQLLDENITEKIRTAGKSLIGQAARAALWGNFKISSLPFPISGSRGVPEIKQFTQMMLGSMPIYLNAAAETNDHIERFKLVICSAVGYLYADKYFEKPLESMLGETAQGYG